MCFDCAMDPAAEVEACLKSVDDMIVQAKLLVAEYNDQAPQSASDVPTLQHSIAFAELRILAQTGREALKRAFPDDAKLSEGWYVPNDVEPASPIEVLTDLKQKRTTLVHALNLLGVTPKVSGLEKQKPKWRLLLDYLNVIPRAIAWIGGIGGGIGIILLVVHWTFGLF